MISVEEMTGPACARELFGVRCGRLSCSPERLTELKAKVRQFQIEIARDLEAGAAELKVLADEWSVVDGDGL